MKSDDEMEPEPPFAEVVNVSIAALFPPFFLWLIAPSAGDGAIIRFVFGLVKFWPSVTLGVVFAAVSCTSYVSTVGEWLVYAAGFFVVALVGCLIVWQNLVSYGADPPKQNLLAWSILAALLIVSAPGAVARPIYSSLHRRWLAAEYALVASFVTTMWAAAAGPRLVINL